MGRPAQELRIGELIQSKSTDFFRSKVALAVKSKPDTFAFQDVRMLFNGGFIALAVKGKPDTFAFQDVRRSVIVGRNLGKLALLKVSCTAGVPSR